MSKPRYQTSLSFEGNSGAINKFLMDLIGCYEFTINEMKPYEAFNREGFENIVTTLKKLQTGGATKTDPIPEGRGFEVVLERSKGKLSDSERLAIHFFMYSKGDYDLLPDLMNFYVKISKGTLLTSKHYEEGG